MEREQKARYLAETLQLVEKLMKEAEDCKSEIDRKKELSFLRKIKANTIVLLLRCGFNCYGEGKNWKSEAILKISINQTVYEIALQEIRTILSKDTEELLNHLYHTSPINNTVNVDEKTEKVKEENSREVKITETAGEKNIATADAEMSKEIAEKKEEERLKELEEEEIEIIEMNAKIIETPARFDVKNLVMDVWTFELKDTPGEIYRILIAPVHFETKKVPFASTFAIGIHDKESVVGASAHKSRTSYEIRLNGKMFIIRGKWEDEDFSSIVYPLNIKTEPYEVKKIQYRPEHMKEVGHPRVEQEDKIFHFLPLSTSNEVDGYARFLVCVEDKNQYSVFKNGKNKLVDAKINNISYQIFAKWEDNIFLGYVQKK